MADHREMLRHNAFFQKVYNKEISALRLSGVSSHTQLSRTSICVTKRVRFCVIQNLFLYLYC